jgi:hypothetical protein
MLEFNEYLSNRCPCGSRTKPAWVTSFGMDQLSTNPYADPFQIVGHCLLALIAAALGGMAAPFVCDLARARP